MGIGFLHRFNDQQSKSGYPLQRMYTTKIISFHDVHSNRTGPIFPFLIPNQALFFDLDIFNLFYLALSASYSSYGSSTITEICQGSLFTLQRNHIMETRFRDYQHFRRS